MKRNQKQHVKSLAGMNYSPAIIHINSHTILYDTRNISCRGIAGMNNNINNTID